MSNLFIKDKEYSKQDVIAILKANNLPKIKMFFNIYGYSTYYTINKTFATPSGNYAGLPQNEVIYSN